MKKPVDVWFWHHAWILGEQGRRSKPADYAGPLEEDNREEKSAEAKP
jgi:hypothetical protein